jgi:hypothetical protein
MGSQISDATRFKRGRGEGTGDDYNPWIWVTDFSSHGLRYRIPGIKSNRIHHLLSLLEARVFYIIESMNCNLEIREQYPLFPLSETLEIAESLNIKHPKRKGIPLVRTVDFYVITKGDPIAIAVKYKKDLKKKRVRELLEIERQFFLRRGIRYRIITEVDFTREAYKNAQRNRCFNGRPNVQISNQDFILMLKQCRHGVVRATKEVLREIAIHIREPFAKIHHLFLHLILEGNIKIDSNKVYAINSKTNDLWF